MAFTCLNPDQAVKVEASYLQPTFTVSYIEINICAAVTFPGVLGVEVITPTDLVNLTFSKPINDLQYILDQDTLGIDKSIRDGLSVTDFVATLLVFQRTFSEIASLSDASIRNLTKPLSDTISVPDLATLSFVKTPSTDQVTSADTSYKDFEKLVKGLAQNYCDPSYFLEDYVQDIVTGDWVYASDSVTKLVTYGRQINDNMPLSSSGLLSMQNYSDLTYFLEDYVGTSRTFT
jgi:hypothetical protein